MEDELGTPIRKFVCGGCLCEFYMPTGIEPSYCPHCSGEIGEVRVLQPDSEDLGFYQEEA